MSGNNEAEIAKFILKPLGEVPSNLRLAVQSLVTDSKKNLLTEKSLERALTLLNIVGIRGAVYYAGLTFKGDSVMNDNNLSLDELARLFNTFDTACILSGVYWFRRCKRFAPKDIWGNIEKNAVQECELGGYLGEAIGDIGLGTGMLIGLLPQIAISLLAKYKPEEYKTYSEYIKKTGQINNLRKEQELFGTTHADIAGLMLSLTGFGPAYSSLFSDGLRFKNQEVISENKEAAKFRAAALWLESLINKKEALANPPEGYNLSDQEDKAVLISLAEAMANEGSEFSWVAKTKEDITPDKIPSIFSEKEKTMHEEAKKK